MHTNNTTPSKNITTEENSTIQSKLPPNNPIMSIITQVKKTDIFMSHNDYIISEQQRRQNEINKEKTRKKLEIIQKNFGMQTEKDATIRPTSEFLDKKIIDIITELDNDQLSNIIQFITLQNIACAFDCCANKTEVERIQDLADIYTNSIPQGKYLHFHLYWNPGWTQNDWENKKQQNKEYALEYFQVFLKDQPQNPEDRKKILQEIQNVYNLPQ